MAGETNYAGGMKQKLGGIGFLVDKLFAGTLLQVQQSTESFETTKAEVEKSTAISQSNLAILYRTGGGVT